MKKKLSMTELVRQAIRESGLTPYRICMETGLNQAALSRFLHGKVGLSVASLEKLAPLVGLELVRTSKKKGG